MKRIVLFIVCVFIVYVLGYALASGIKTYYQCAEMYKFFQVVKMDFDPKAFLADITKIKRDMVVAKHVVIDNRLGLEKLREDFERNEAEFHVEEAKIFVVAKSAKTQASSAESLATKAETHAQQALDKTKELSVEGEVTKLIISQIQKKNLELELGLLRIENTHVINLLEREQIVLEDLKDRLTSLQALGRDRRSFIYEMTMCKYAIENEEKILNFFRNLCDSQIKQMSDLSSRINH